MSKVFNLNAIFMDMYFEDRKSPSKGYLLNFSAPSDGWNLEPKMQSERTLSPIMRRQQTDDIMVNTDNMVENKLDKAEKSKKEKDKKTLKELGLMPTKKRLKFITDNSVDSGHGGGGIGGATSEGYETNNETRVRPIPTRKPQNTVRENNVEWIDKISNILPNENKVFILNSFEVPYHDDYEEGHQLIPRRDLPDGFHKRPVLTPYDQGHTPFMRHKEPGENLSKIPVEDLPTKPFFENKIFRPKKKHLQYDIKKSFKLNSDILLEVPYHSTDINRPPQALIDFDETISQGPGRNISDPFPRVKEALQKLRDNGIQIIIDTVRGDIDNIKEYLDHFEIPYDYINYNPYQSPEVDSSVKLKGDVLIDDKAVSFEGVWNDEFVNSIINEIKKNRGFIEKQSFRLNAITLDWSSSLRNKYISELLHDYKEKVINMAIEVWQKKGISKEDIITKWDELSDKLDKVSKNEFLAIYNSYATELYGSYEDFRKRTSNVNIIDSSHTDIGKYDNMLKNPEYHKKEKGLQFEIVSMSPDEYLRRVAQMQGVSFGDTLRMISEENMQELREVVKSGKKLPLPFIDYADNFQEGRHRAVLAKEFGQTSIPVMIVTKVDGIEKDESRADGLNPKPYYGDTNIYPYRGTGVGLPSSTFIEPFDTVTREVRVADNKLIATIQTTNIPEELQKQLKDIQNSIDKDSLYIGENEEKFDISNGLPNHFHITVAYNIDTNEKDKIQTILNKYTDIKIKTDGVISYMNDDNYTSVVLLCESEDLKKLRNELLENIKNNDKGEFTSHISIAYLKPNEKLSIELKIQPIEWIGRDFSISYEGNIVPLSKKSFRINSSISIVKDESFKHSLYSKLSALDGDTKIGYLVYGVDADTIFIRAIGVQDLYRRQHIATQMIDFVRDEFPNRDLDWGETSQLGAKLKEYTETRKSFKLIAQDEEDKPTVSQDAYDAFTEKSYVFKNYQLTSEQIEDAIDKGKDLSILLKYQKMSPDQKQRAVNRAIEKNVALIYLYENEKESLTDVQYKHLINSLYKKAIEDGTNLIYILRNFELPPAQKETLVQKALEEGIGLHFLFKKRLLTPEQQDYAVKKAIETGYGLLDLLKYMDLTPEQRKTVIDKCIEKGVALVHLLRKETLTEEQKNKVFSKSLREGKGYHYILRNYKLTNDQINLAIRRSKHKPDNLKLIQKYQDVTPEQTTYIDNRIEKMKSKKSSVDSEYSFVLPGEEGFEELQQFFREADDESVMKMYEYIESDNLEDAKKLLEDFLEVEI